MNCVKHERRQIIKIIDHNVTLSDTCVALEWRIWHAETGLWRIFSFLDFDGLNKFASSSKLHPVKGLFSISILVHVIESIMAFLRLLTLIKVSTYCMVESNEGGFAFTMTKTRTGTRSSAPGTLKGFDNFSKLSIAYE